MTVEGSNVVANEIINTQLSGEPAAEESIDTALADQETANLKSNDKEAAEDPESDEFSKKFAALSRKEKALREKESSYEQKLAELQAKMEEIEASKEVEPEKAPELPLEYRIKKDPLGTLQELGLDFDTLTELAVNDGKLTTDMQMKLMREEIAREMEEKYGALEEKLTAKEKAEEEAKYNRVIEDFKSNINNFVEQNAEVYELIQANNATDLVYDVIETHHKETQRVLEIEDAAKAVESYLEEEARKLLKLKKFSQSQEEPSENQKPENRQAPLTLSNDHSAASQNTADRKLSHEESIAAAAKLIKWND